MVSGTIVAMGQESARITDMKILMWNILIPSQYVGTSGHGLAPVLRDRTRLAFAEGPSLEEKDHGIDQKIKRHNPQGICQRRQTIIMPKEEE